MDAATRQGIVVSLAPGGNSTTELAFGLMLAVMRRIPQSDRAMRRGEWPLVLGYVLKGKTLGILGLGKIGTEVAAIGRAFGMKRHCLGSDADHRAGGQIRCDLHASG